jgi:putative phosphoesterase
MVGPGTTVQRYSDKPGRKLLERAERLALDEHNGLRVAIVADTHSQPHPRAAELLSAQRPSAILHAGDIGDLSVLDDLAKVAPVIAVRGNIDERAPHLPDVVTIDVCAGEQSALRLLITHIAVYGAKLRADAAQLAVRHSARLVVCGHSHVPFLGKDRGLTVFNPGSIGPRRMHLPIVFGMMEIANAKLSFRHIDCETGREWLP